MKKILLVSGAFIFATVILLVSIFNSSSITYSLSKSPEPALNGIKAPDSESKVPYMGNVLPDSPLWGLKVLRDKIWFGVTTSHLRKAQLALLFSDKRILMTKVLFEKGKPDIALSTFLEGEKYLVTAVNEEKNARSQGVNTDDFLMKLASSAAQHKVIMDGLMYLVPDDIKPEVIEVEKFAKNAFESAREGLNFRNLPIPKDPFDRE